MSHKQDDPYWQEMRHSRVPYDDSALPSINLYKQITSLFSLSTCVCICMHRTFGWYLKSSVSAP